MPTAPSTDTSEPIRRAVAFAAPRWLALALVAVTLVRIAAAVWAGIWNIRGDYYASMPGAYVETFNPALWNSPDMEGAWGYHKHTYFHGPTQYLTLYFAAVFDSYARIAAVLLPLYAGILGAAFTVLYRALRPLAAAAIAAPLFASTFLFFPLLQAFIQREFEIIVFFALALMLSWLLADRRGRAAAAMAYIAWYKYAALVFVGYLGLRRWWRAIAAFLIASLVILGLAELVFGLALFFNNNVPSHAAQVLNVWRNEFRTDEAGHLYGVGFCNGWFDNETTLANVRHGLCTVSATVRWLPPQAVYLLLCAAVAIIFLVAHLRLERVRPAGDDERWRRAFELSIVVTSYTCFLFNHYYYLIALALPLNVLLVRLLDRRAWLRLALWALAYVTISAFLVPTSILTRLAGIDVWAFFINGAWFMYGELLMMGLLLREYWELAAVTQKKGRPAFGGQSSAM
jgi:hypothetical protein